MSQLPAFPLKPTMESEVGKVLNPQAWHSIFEVCVVKQRQNQQSHFMYTFLRAYHCRTWREQELRAAARAGSRKHPWADSLFKSLCPGSLVEGRPRPSSAKKM